MTKRLSRGAKECAPNIWRKFNTFERHLWDIFYDLFIDSINYHTDWSGSKHSEQRKVTAHNMACQAVWELMLMKMTSVSVKRILD